MIDEIKKITYVTGSRSEFGLMKPLLDSLDCHPKFDLNLIVTGSHLTQEYGLSYREIEVAGLAILASIDLGLSCSSSTNLVESMSVLSVELSREFNHSKPDIILIMGDRYEMLVVAFVAMMMRIPVAHVSGGEKTNGVIDDSIRHAITKLSHLHFVANEEYKRRVIQLGESPENVYNVGDPGLDDVHDIAVMDRSEFEQRIDWALGKVNFLITFHSVTLGTQVDEGLDALLNALSEYPSAHFIFTGPNAEMGSDIITQKINNFICQNLQRARMYVSLGRELYLNAVKHCDLVIGNSSSGLVEAPALRTPCINMGDRQQGRLKARSVIDARNCKNEIITAINMGLSSDFLSSLHDMDCPYGDGQASERIVNTFLHASFENLLKKDFHDVDVHSKRVTV